MRSMTNSNHWQEHRSVREILSAIAAPDHSARHENPYPRTRRSARQGADLVTLRTQSRRQFLDRHQRMLEDARWPMLAAYRLPMARDSGDASIRVARSTSIPRFEREWRVAVADCALARRALLRDDLVVTTFGLS
ncbi:MAG: hypothetical protein QOK40_2234 [Miltoncostaeaceae bacterium]|jgi:hypothetical protein|nr:hypothetical protein [Miltoncostaeaceae bacterium]